MTPMAWIFQVSSFAYALMSGLTIAWAVFRFASAHQLRVRVRSNRGAVGVFDSDMLVKAVREYPSDNCAANLYPMLDDMFADYLLEGTFPKEARAIIVGVDENLARRLDSALKHWRDNSALQEGRNRRLLSPANSTEKPEPAVTRVMRGHVHRFCLIALRGL